MSTLPERFTSKHQPSLVQCKYDSKIIDLNASPKATDTKHEMKKIFIMQHTLLYLRKDKSCQNFRNECNFHHRWLRQSMNPYCTCIVNVPQITFPLETRQNLFNKSEPNLEKLFHNFQYATSTAPS